MLCCKTREVAIVAKTVVESIGACCGIFSRFNDSESGSGVKKDGSGNDSKSGSGEVVPDDKKGVIRESGGRNSKSGSDVVNPSGSIVGSEADDKTPPNEAREGARHEKSTEAGRAIQAKSDDSETPAGQPRPGSDSTGLPADSTHSPPGEPLPRPAASQAHAGGRSQAGGSEGPGDSSPVHVVSTTQVDAKGSLEPVVEATVPNLKKRRPGKTDARRRRRARAKYESWLVNNPLANFQNKKQWVVAKNAAGHDNYGNNRRRLGSAEKRVRRIFAAIPLPETHRVLEIVEPVQQRRALAETESFSVFWMVPAAILAVGCAVGVGSKCAKRCASKQNRKKLI